MRAIKHTLILAVFFVASSSTLAQSKKIQRANDIFDAGEYFRASEKYAKLYSKAKTKIVKAELAFKLGLCYRKMNIPKKAEKWFNRSVKLRYQDPMAVCYLADAMKMNEKYADALVTYEQYKDLVPDDPRGRDGMKSCELALKWLDNPGRYEIENMKDINSKQSDYSPEFFKDNSVIYFTSTREGGTGNKFNNNSGQYFSDIFFTMRDRKGKWSEPIPANGEINTIFDEGACSINLDGSDIYFTSCKAIKGETLGCQIYYSNYSGQGWSQPELVPLVEDSSISVGHPAVSADELTLYFVSEMEGGAGGKDIWKSTRPSRGQPWGKPKNLGSPVNTAGDEMYPYVREDGTLYFASNGHIGLGGLDIFMLGKDDEDRPLVVNMKPPINSPADDFGIIFDGKKERGYFSTTRKGKGNDDIYSFELPSLVFTLKGTVRNEATDATIAGAKVKLEGSDGTSLETNSGSDGGFKFRLKPSTDYVIMTSKPTFLKGKATESTRGREKSTDIVVEIFMSPITTDGIEVQNVFYDVNKANLRPESMVSLDELVEKLKFNDNITVELSAHTDFRGSEADNMELSQRRSQSVVNYLIQKGIKPERLIARGYGESQPRKISKKVAAKYDFLKEGDVLTEEFIKALTDKEQVKIAHQINRRTEFKVIKTDYDESGETFGG